MSNIASPSEINATPPHFTITSWNCRGLLANSSSIQLFLYYRRPAILIISEPLVSNKPNPNFPKFTNYNIVIVKHPFEQSHGGFVIYFHNTITYNQHIAPHFTSHTSSTAALFHVSSPMLCKPFLLAPIYMSSNATTHDWDKLIRIISSAPYTYTDIPMPVLVMGDMNVHDPMWDPSYPRSYSDPSGSRLVDFLCQDNDWHLLNFRLPVMKPTRISPRPDERDTVIDLAICNNFDMVQDFQVDDYDLLLSDHLPIHTQLPTSSTNVVATPQRLIWRTSRPNIPWDTFQSLLTHLLAPWHKRWVQHRSWHHTTTQQDIDECWEQLRAVITKQL